MYDTNCRKHDMDPCPVCDGCQIPNHTPGLTVCLDCPTKENTSMKTKIHTATYTDPTTGWEQRVRVTDVFYNQVDQKGEDAELLAAIEDGAGQFAHVSVEHITEVRLEEVEG